MKGIKLWPFDNNLSEFCAYFHCARAETAIWELLVKNLTLPFAPAILISYKTGIFPLSDDVFGIYLMFCAQFLFDLVTLTFDLLTLAVSEE